MKTISLTQGKVAMIDDADFDWLNQYKWCAVKYRNAWYAARTICRDGKWTTIGMHREILGLQLGDKRESDHINHNTLDNRRTNLRIVTRSENQWNQTSRKGYCWNEQAGRFLAYIRVRSKRIYLGYFDSGTEAHQAYLVAKKVYHKIA